MNLTPIADLLKERVGLDVAALGMSTFRAAVTEHMQTLALAEPNAYAAYLANRSDELEWLLNRLLVPESWFFRGGELFHFLAREIAASLQTAADKHVFRVLCLPCSTGDEPYSLAIALLEAGVPSDRWRIDGIDLSRQFVAAAIRGMYREFSFRQTPPELRSRYFREMGSDWVLDPVVRARVDFQTGNIMDLALLDGSTGAYDLILCRNLLIYLTLEARSRAIANLERLLAPCGLLGVGHAEPQIVMGRGYRRFGPESCFLYRREVGRLAPSGPGTPGGEGRGEGKRDPLRRLEFSAGSAPSPPTPLPRSTGGEERKSQLVDPAPVDNESSLSDARCLADQGSLDDALAICLAHLGDSEPSADAYSLLGVIQQARGDSALANEAFRKALYLDPDHREALTHAMLLSSRRGDEARAVALRERLTRIGNGDEQ